MKTQIPILIGTSLLLLAASCTDSRSPRYADAPNGDDVPWRYFVGNFDSLEYFHLSSYDLRVTYLLKKDGSWFSCIDGYYRTHAPFFKGNYPALPADQSKVVANPARTRVGIIYQRAVDWRHTSQPAPANDPRRPRQWFVEIDRRVLGGFDGDVMPNLCFTTDGGTFALSYKKLGQYYVQVVDTTLGPYQRADVAITGGDKIFLAYLAKGEIIVHRVK